MLEKDCLKRETDLNATRTQLVFKDQELQNALQEIHRLKESNAKLRESNARVTAETLEDLEQQYRSNELEKINTSLSRKIKVLRVELKKRDSIIQLQQDVIRLLDDAQKTIETSLNEQVAKKLSEIEAIKKQFRKVFPDTVLFNSGSMTITEEGEKILLEFAGSVKEYDYLHIRVEGHADNAPPQKTNLTNWELSAARAIAVVRFLETKAGLDASRLSATAYGASRPIAVNDTEAGHHQNRRIELVIHY